MRAGQLCAKEKGRVLTYAVFSDRGDRFAQPSWLISFASFRSRVDSPKVADQKLFLKTWRGLQDWPLQRRCRIVRRQGEPSTLDRLTDLDPTFDQPGAAVGDEARTAA